MFEAVRKHQTLIVGALGLAVLGWIGSAYLGEREDRLRMEERVRAAEEGIKLERKMVEAADRRIEERAKALQESVDEIRKLRAQPATVREIVREIPHYLPLSGLPMALTTTPQASSPTVAGQPEEALVFSAAQAQELRDFYLDCAQTRLELNACGGDVKDLVEKSEALGAQVRLTERQRDAALAAARGGTFWTRVRRAGKWFLAGAVVGATAGIVAASR